MWLRALFIITTAIIFLGCKEEPEVTPATYSNIITGGTSKAWRRDVNFQVSFNAGGGNQLQNIPSTIPPCQRDDVFIFYREANFFELSEGLSTCSEDVEQTIVTGRWGLNTVNLTLSINNTEFTIEEISESTMVLSEKQIFTINTTAGASKDVIGDVIFTYTAN